MSFGRKTSEKDQVFFITREDVQQSNTKPTKDTSEKGAFDPVTGEINFDCPCLGGMAHGPCGEEFKASFSCFVYSNAEPKGADCIDKFRAMQRCFQNYPEYYADQLAEDATSKQPKSTDTPVSSSSTSTSSSTSGIGGTTTTAQPASI